MAFGHASSQASGDHQALHGSPQPSSSLYAPAQHTYNHPQASGETFQALNHDHSHAHAHDHAHHDHGHSAHQDHSHAHDHDQHDHHSHHDHHGHGHDHHDHAHDHSHAHDHHGHHGHDHHGHDHHGHSHDHHGHSHDHHDFPPVYIPPLPTWSEIFATLSPAQKTIFTWFSIHFFIGICVYCAGAANESLAMLGFAYLVFFDALGVLNGFVSNVIRTQPAFVAANTKRPFGAHRLEIIVAMANTVYLLFATMQTTKESLEHFLLEGHHGGGEEHTEAGLGLLSYVVLVLAIGTCFFASVTLRNHENFVRFLRRTPPTVQGFSYHVLNGTRGNPLHVILSNVYSLCIVGSGLVVCLFNFFGLITPTIDKCLALGEAVLMFYLGYPTAKALANLLLQTSPNTVRHSVDHRLAEIRQNPSILRIERVHFWQNTYGRCVGTLEVYIRPDADEQAILQFVYQKLEGLTSVSESYDEKGQQRSELTVSIIKS
ncbi:cation efflux protein [Hesseltinella vesiculosa]|uniref:Cation efflux protein n=1 Tax=Hesseltinella vesiculosa TaxID=101127 RepID=A0A1X2GEU5_9FUNG|nr:cation efflux protein [Hesseltinella vesiculosa]